MARLNTAMGTHSGAMPSQASSSELFSPQSGSERAPSPMEIDHPPLAAISSPNGSSGFVTDSSDEVRSKASVGPKRKSEKGKGKAIEVPSADADDSDDNDSDRSLVKKEKAPEDSTSRLLRESRFPTAPSFDTRLPVPLMTDITVEEIIAYYPNHAFNWPGLALLIAHYMMRCSKKGHWTNRVHEIINQSRNLIATGVWVTRFEVRYWLEQTIKMYIGDHYQITEIAHDNALRTLVEYDPSVNDVNELINKHIWDLPTDKEAIQWKDAVHLHYVGETVRVHPRGKFSERVQTILAGKVGEMPAPLAPGALHPLFASIPVEALPLPVGTLGHDQYPVHIAPLDVMRYHWKDLTGEVFLYVLKAFGMANLLPMYVEVAGIPKDKVKNAAENLRKKRERALRMRVQRNKTTYPHEVIEFSIEMHDAGHATVKPREMNEDQVKRWRGSHPLPEAADAALEREAIIRDPAAREALKRARSNSPPALPAETDENGDVITRTHMVKRRKLVKLAMREALVAAVARPCGQEPEKDFDAWLAGLEDVPPAVVDKVWDPATQCWKYPDERGNFVLLAPLQIDADYLDDLLKLNKDMVDASTDPVFNPVDPLVAVAVANDISIDAALLEPVDTDFDPILIDFVHTLELMPAESASGQSAVGGPVVNERVDTDFDMSMFPVNETMTSAELSHVAAGFDPVASTDLSTSTDVNAATGYTAPVDLSTLTGIRPPTDEELFEMYMEFGGDSDDEMEVDPLQDSGALVLYGGTEGEDAEMNFGPSQESGVLVLYGAVEDEDAEMGGMNPDGCDEDTDDSSVWGSSSDEEDDGDDGDDSEDHNEGPTEAEAFESEYFDKIMNGMDPDELNLDDEDGSFHPFDFTGSESDSESHSPVKEDAPLDYGEAADSAVERAPIGLGLDYGHDQPDLGSLGETLALPLDATDTTFRSFLESSYEANRTVLKRKREDSSEVKDDDQPLEAVTTKKARTGSTPIERAFTPAPQPVALPIRQSQPGGPQSGQFVLALRPASSSGPGLQRPASAPAAAPAVAPPVAAVAVPPVVPVIVPPTSQFTFTLPFHSRVAAQAPAAIDTEGGNEDTDTVSADEEELSEDPDGIA